jgi:CheY-like chemotaxis protein
MDATASPGRILVVEDNPDGLDTVLDLLRSNGHAVVGAADGAEALRAVRHWTPDLVLLDLGLPAMDGYEVATRLRGALGLASLPVIALTGWGSQQDRARTAAAGFNAHLTKPVRPEQLLQVIDEWMTQLDAVPKSVDG